MIRITVDEEKCTIEIDEVTYYGAIEELTRLIRGIKSDEILGKMYPLAKFIEENNAKNNTGN